MAPPEQEGGRLLQLVPAVETALALLPARFDPVVAAVRRLQHFEVHSGGFDQVADCHPSEAPKQRLGGQRVMKAGVASLLGNSKHQVPFARLHHSQ